MRAVFVDLLRVSFSCFLFFFNDTATTEIYPLSLHDALPICLPDDTIRIHFEGTGGQSFGAFLCNGITLNLRGDANDYTGKGLSGGRVVVHASHEFRGDTTTNTIVGNTDRKSTRLNSSHVRIS